MDLLAAAGYFTDIALYDAYSGLYLYDAQLSESLSKSANGSISRRRAIQLLPGKALPPRRAVEWFGEIWVLGDSTQDGLQGISLRQTVAAKKSTDLFKVLTPGQAALGLAGKATYGQKEYFKDVINNQTDSEYDPFWNIAVGATEPIVKGTYFVSGATTYRARSVHQVLEGFQVAAADQLDLNSASVVFAGSTYDPITDTYLGSGVTTTGLLLDGYQLYQYLHPSSAKMLPGDQTLVVAQSAITPVVGGVLTAQGRTWRIESMLAELDGWNLHIRGR